VYIEPKQKKVAIVQSNYIPWKGYFDMIAAVDEFILYDDMQYTRRDWRNRNQIKTPQGVQWLTVPVLVKGKYDQRIRDTQIEGKEWAANHWKTLTQNYSRSSHFKDIAAWLEPLYLATTYTHISQLNRSFIQAICTYLKIETTISNSWDYILVDGKSEKLADICTQANATDYLSGPSAKDYIEHNVFADRGIQIHWADYSHYPEYPQLWGTFCHGVTILDLLFNCGEDSHLYMGKISL
jgi:glutaredoxin-related protein